MKNILLILLALPLLATAQYKRADIFNASTPIVWLGIDFSKARIEGYDYPDKQFKEVFFYGWNEMIRNHDDALDVHKYLHRKKVDISIEETNRLNSSISRNLRSSSSVDRNSIIEALKGYNVHNQSGIGVVLFVSDIVHKGEHLYGKIAFVDLESGKLLLLKKFEGSGRGFGFNNTWSNAIKSAMGYVRRHWNNWERQVNKADNIHS